MLSKAVINRLTVNLASLCNNQESFPSVTSYGGEASEGNTQS